MPTSHPGRAILVCLLLLGLLPTTAAGADPSAEIDVSRLQSWQGRHVSGLTITGLPGDLAKQAESGLALKPRRKFMRMRKPLLDAATAHADARRLRLLLARNGYPHAVIVGSGEADGDENVTVTFAVTLGPMIVFGETVLVGVPAAATVPADSARTRLVPGTRFQESEVFAVQGALVLAMRRAGHPHSAVDVAVVRPDSSRVDVTYTCTPGALFVYGDLIVEGSPDDLTPLVHRTVGLKPGTPYSPRIATNSRRYLRDLDLFRQIRLQNVPHDSTTLDMVADLRERKMLTLDASVGTFTDNPVVITVEAKHRNIFKRGRGLGSGASYATHLRWAEIRTWWQGLGVPRSRTDLRLRYEVQDEDSYRLDTASAALSTLFNYWEFSSVRTALSVSNGVLDNRSADPDAFIDDVGLQTVLTAAWFRDTSDNPLDPLTGKRLNLQGDWSPPGFWTENPFAAIRANGSRYFNMGGTRVLATRLDMSVAWPLGDAIDLTPDRRWYAGGVSSMRGYGRRRLGPVDSADNPIGGEARLLAGLEVRMPVVSIVGLALFVDTGQVWRRMDDISFNHYQAAVGTGILFGTPVGPLRLDFAYLVTEPERPESRWQFHFAIGHPY